jgi:hypothetical protein
MKALELLKTNKTISQRAEKYHESIKRNIQRDILDKLTADIENMEDVLFELTDFVLDTNINRGLAQMTKEDCEKRFKKIIETEFELELLKQEQKIKKVIYEKYF